METKNCAACKQALPLELFNWKNKGKGVRYSDCKTCWNAKNKERYRKNKQYYIDKAQTRINAIRQWLVEYKVSIGCPCGENHPACLHFHHRIPAEKEFEICDAVLTRAKSRIEAEIEKCDVLCANCHAKLHYTEIHPDVA